MTAIPKIEHITTSAGSDQRQGQVQFNQSLADDAQGSYAYWGDAVLAWFTGVPASGLTIGRGGTDTNIATGQVNFKISGQAASEVKAAVTAGTAIGAQTVTADQWALYALDIASGGTITVTPAAGNVAGYATEPLAIAALPPRTTVKARLGFITVKTKAATVWVAGTDGLAGGATGNFASFTNYYPFSGQFAPTGTPTSCSLAGGMGALWTAGANGVVIPTTLARGATDTNVATIACTYNAGGACNIPKAAVSAGTALGALGTVPKGTWAAIAVFIDIGGTITFASGGDNYGTGYASNQAAINAMSMVTPPANKCMLGYFTLTTKDAATAWIAGTDALAGGSSGNPAAFTNYYPTPGFTPSAGVNAAPIASRTGTVLGPPQY